MRAARPSPTAAILLIWLAATAPMAVLAWGVAPRLIKPDDPLPGLVFWTLVVVGMAWQFGLSLIVLRLEGVPFRPRALARRLWLTLPVWRPSGRPAVLAFLLIPVFLALALVSSLFNYVLGEALLFHGVLLPRMEQAWGRWAWLGNGLLFAAYHVHKFWNLPGLVVSCLAYALPAQAFRSNWLAILIHGLEGLVLIVAVLAVILGYP
jgi:membrane protease YdiL (CAAX protease family)